MAVHTGTELKKDLRRDVVDQVVHLVIHLNSQQGPAGSHVRSQPFLVLDHPAEGALHHAHVTMERACYPSTSSVWSAVAPQGSS